MRGAADARGTWVQLCEPVGLGYLAASLRAARHEVTIVDAITRWLSVDEVVADALSRSPDFVGIAYTAEDRQIIADSCEVAARLKRARPDLVIGAGGMFATMAAQWLLERCPAIDVVLRGECESSLPRLVAGLTDRRAWREIPGATLRGPDGGGSMAPIPILADLALLPQPAHDCIEDNLEHGGRSMNLIASKGCFLHCDFCTIHQFNNSPRASWWRARPVTDVVDEMEEAQRRFGVRYFRFLDDEWVGPGREGREHAWHFARELRRRGLACRFNIICRPGSVEPELFGALRSVGLHQVFIGAESGSSAFLRRYHKAQTVRVNLRALEVLRSLQVRVLMGFIMFDVGSTLDEIEDNLCFLGRLSDADDVEVESFLGDIVPLVGAHVQTRGPREPSRNTDDERICEDDRAEAVRQITRQILGRLQNLHSHERYRLEAELPRLDEDTTPRTIVRANDRIRRIFVEEMEEAVRFVREHGTGSAATSRWVEAKRPGVEQRSDAALRVLYAMRRVHYTRWVAREADARGPLAAQAPTQAEVLAS
jgi:radical SAM superfamily enzyme YgiQ (UPF0313 family)